MNGNDTFNYTYSAMQREEIKAIRKKYSAPEESEDKMARLRRLDQSASRRASVISLILGIAGALIMGFGMSLTMSPLPGALGISTTAAMAVGISVGIVGMVSAGLAYPAYNRVLKKQRERLAPEIIRLTDELLGG